MLAWGFQGRVPPPVWEYFDLVRTPRPRLAPPSLKEHPGTLLLAGSEAELLAESLRELGFEVEASPTEELLDRAQIGLPSCVLLSDLSACRTLRSDEQTAAIPVVYYSPHDLTEEEQVAAYEVGASDVLDPGCSRTLMAARLGALMALCRSHRRLHDRLIRDELTGVFSRRYLFESLRQHVSRFSRPGPRALACLMVEVDHFERLNERLGSREGDRILRMVAQQIIALTRKGDLVARFGGEEFVVILPSTDGNGAVKVAEKLRSSVAEQRVGAHKVTVSVGASWYEYPTGADWSSELENDAVISMLLSRAEDSLHRARSAGTNRVCLHVEYLDKERRRHPRLGLSLPADITTPAGQTFRRNCEVSLGGMSFPTEKGLELKVGERIEIVLHLDPPLNLSGQIMWAKVGVRCGMAFGEMGDSEHNRLCDFLGHRTKVSQRRGRSSRS